MDLSELVITQAGEQGEPQQRRIISGPSLNANKILHKAENAWRPLFGKLACDRGVTEEERKTQEVLRELQAILNKLTPGNFGSLMKRLSRLEINTEARLKAVIGLIFDKAVSEQSYCPAYAKMCHHFLGLNVATEDGHRVTFQKVLLRHCQSQFEKNHNEEEMINIQKELDATENEASCQQLKLKLENVRFTSHHRSLGIVKLIGELFKLKMLTANIMHHCVVKLLKDEHEESLECLCKLMSTIGKDLDTPSAKPDMDHYFAYINKIIQEKNTSTRTRFMLLDMIDLRKNNWVPRRDEEGPKVIRQLHLKAKLAFPGQRKGGLITQKGDSRWQLQEKKGLTNPGDKPSTTEQEPCSEDSRGDTSEHSDLTSADGHQSRRSNNDLNSNHEDCLLDGAHHRGQFEISTIGHPLQRRSGGSPGSGKPELPGNWRNRIPHNSNVFDKHELSLDQENWHHRSKDQTKKFGRNGESSRGGKWRLRKDVERGHPDRSDSLSKSQNWHFTRKIKGSDQESYRYNNWHKQNNHERDHLAQFGNFPKSQNWHFTRKIKGSDQESYRYNNWHKQNNHERDHLAQFGNFSKSQNWHFTKKIKGSDQESYRYNNWHRQNNHERDHLAQFGNFSKSQNWHFTRKIKGSDQESYRYNNWHRQNNHERDHLAQFGNFSKSQNWRNTTTFKGSGQVISRYNNWRLKVDHERPPLDQSDHLCNSQNWQVPSNNVSSEQDSSWYNNRRFKGDHRRDRQNRSEQRSDSQDLHDTRPNGRSGPSNARSSCEWRNQQSKTSHRNNKQRNKNTFKRGEDTSNCKNWHAINERKQQVQKILNLDSEKWRIRPDYYRSDCNLDSGKWPHREYRDRNQSDRVVVKPKLDAREVIKKRLVAKDSENKKEKVAVENNMTKDLMRLQRGQTSNQQLTSGIEANLSNQELSSTEFVQVLMTSVSPVDVLPGGVHQLSRSKVIQPAEILKKYLNDGQKQREALKALQNVMA